MLKIKGNYPKLKMNLIINFPTYCIKYKANIKIKFKLLPLKLYFRDNKLV